jgi:endonuclease/exonuclease/phosphatase family metal-dependent hydrolase
MKIATWNVERLKHKSDLDKILECCETANADIFVLTETDSRIRLPYPHCHCTLPASEKMSELYMDTENRVSIYTKYRFVRQHETYDKYTAVCIELETERGNLFVYGTIMGIFGNRDASYMVDLEKQMEDVMRLSEKGNMCIIGDFNCSFADNYYFTQKGRNAMLQTFSRCGISILTGKREECIDHIAVSNAFVNQARTEVTEWNYDKALSDHKGIVVDIMS